MNNKTPITLIIMDGFGNAETGAGNAISCAETPNLDKIFAANPKSALKASGLAVGLPDGQMGNSEVGHTNIGAGRVVFQDLPRISCAIEDGSFFENRELVAACENCTANGTALHLMGLMSDGGVHSHNTHVWGLLRLAKKLGVKKVYLHCFLDGRDVSPTSGEGFVREAMEKCAELGIGEVATLMGRYFAMDRDNRWDRVEKAYRAIVFAEGESTDSAADAVKKSYEDGKTDEFVEPTVCSGYPGMKENDSIIFFNFRPDRAREITRTFVDESFDGFDRGEGFQKVFYVCMTQYDANMPNVRVAFAPESLDNTFGEYVSSLGLSQLRIAETEKYAHVTFFFNGGVEKMYDGEDRILVNSPKVATYDLQPEMSAPEVTEKVLEAISSGKYDVIILNYANCDMVGHTGVFDAAKAAVETVDSCVGRVVDAMRDIGGVSIITADHGNADRMIDEDGVSPFTAHTTNEVPFCIVGADVTLRDGKLCDIAPTMLDLLGLAKPDEMTGESLIVE
ncbi:MAG: 2,3-bisphosphoglycerate-independent phosphoglycerate mutase [Oscillospiraceae bacterium]|nr:2,3-bisphosphoglycerate-independent phosphoglycerate mutase [Oscillospiraceae bacterium]